MRDPLRVELDNGAVLLLHENRSNPSIAFRGSLLAGAAHGPPAVPEFAARLHLRGTKKRSAAQIADAIEGLGSALNASNGAETIAIHGRCTRETLRETLAILVECLAAASFPAAELEKVRGEILGDLRAQQDDTRRAASVRLFELIYPPSHPFHRDPKGDERTVANVRAAEVRSFYASRGGARGAIFAFSGDLDEETFRSTVAAAFEKLDAGDPPIPVPLPRLQKRTASRVEMPHKSQADFAAGRVAIPRTDPDYYALNLANLLFGRIGLYGRLGSRVRDDLGLAYYSFSGLDARRAGGHWTVNAGVSPRNLAKALEAIRAEMERLEREPFTEEEIRDGKDHLVGALQVNLERNAEYATALHDIEYFGLGTDFLARYPSIVRGLKPDDVRRKAVECFDPDRCSWVVSGPVKNLKLAF